MFLVGIVLQMHVLVFQNKLPATAFRTVMRQFWESVKFWGWPVMVLPVHELENKISQVLGCESTHISSILFSDPTHQLVGGIRQMGKSEMVIKQWNSSLSQ